MVNQVPETVEVIVIPLSDASLPGADATYVGGLQRQTIVLSQEDNAAVFDLVPTDEPGLTERILYRIAWRQGVIGRTFTYDFAMPDVDVNFDDLQSLGNIIGGETYLQQSDLGVPGRVARLNDAGQVVDANNIPVAGQADVSSIQGALSVEIVNRQAADRALRSTLETEIADQITSTLNTARAYTDSSSANQSAALSAEVSVRRQADISLGNQISALSTSLTGVTNTVASHTQTLTAKADLVNGKVPINQIPPEAITNWIPVLDTNAMLLLRYPEDVQPGDIALTQDGVIYGLTDTHPDQLNNWIRLNKVTSVNGKDGNVTLTAADVGAVASADGTVSISQVTGLATALSGKADATTVSTLSGTVAGIISDTTIVHTVGGVIPHTLNDSSMAYVNAFDQITKKDGTVIAVGAGAVQSVNTKTGSVVLTAADVGAIATGASIDMSQVTGLSTALSGKVATDDSRLSDARTPTSHAASHGVGQADAITIAQSQVTGLSSTLTNHANRLGSLETRVTSIEEGGGGGGGGGSAGTTQFWSATAPTADFVNDVTFHSPFGNNGSGDYLDPAGAAAGEVRWPYVHASGHLELRPWNPSASPDPTPALASDLSTLSSTVAGKADSSTVSSLASTVAGKADSSTVSTLSSTVAGKADQSALDTLSGIVAGKADSSVVSSLTTTVNGKASASDLSTLQSTVSGISSSLSGKADLSGGVLAAAQVPTIGQDKVTGLSTALAGKADLVGGVLKSDQVPTGISQSNISGLTGDLAAKADLVNGKVKSTQLTPRRIYAVANRSAMLALTTDQAAQGDNCVITATADQGTYTLNGSDPSIFANWLLNTPPASPVSSVNGQVGTVVLDWNSVGALAANAAIPIPQVTNLQTTLDTKATTAALTSGLAGKTSTADVQGILSASTEIKQKANYVATSSVPSLSGQQSIDGVTVPLGSIVLLTNQSSSVTNGLWTVNSSSWTRPSDFSTGSWLVKGTLVMISAGNSNANTFWQCTSASGIVDTNGNNWSKVMQAGPPVTYSSGNGVNVNNSTNVVSAVADPSGGLAVTSQGIAIDTTKVVRKYVGTVPAGNTVATITHNLNTTSVQVSLIHVASGDIRLIGATVTGVNTVSLEFGTAPTDNQYRVIVVG